jgi:hypothetical protein
MVPELQHGAHPARPAAVNEAEVASVGAREELDDGRRLAVRLHRQHDTFIGPVHGVIIAERLE